LLVTREADTREACTLAGKPGRNDQGQFLHLVSRRYVLVVKVGAVRDIEGDSAEPAEAAIDRLFAFAKSLLDVCPVAGTA
jgi:hypothetical protein